MTAAAENEEKIAKMIEKQQHKVLESLRAIFEAADIDGSGDLDRDEFNAAMKQKHVRDRLQLIDIPVSDLNELYELLDEDGSGSITIDEFFKGCVKLKGVAKSRDIIELSMHVTTYLKQATGLLKNMEEQSDTLTDVMNRLEVMDKDFLRTEDAGKKKRKKKEQEHKNAEQETHESGLQS